jgi:hypothetical protein
VLGMIKRELHERGRGQRSAFTDAGKDVVNQEETESGNCRLPIADC